MLRRFSETYRACGVGDNVLEQEIAEQEMPQVVRPNGELKALRGEGAESADCCSLN